MGLISLATNIGTLFLHHVALTASAAQLSGLTTGITIGETLVNALLQALILAKLDQCQVTIGGTKYTVNALLTAIASELAQVDTVFSTNATSSPKATSTPVS